MEVGAVYIYLDMKGDEAVRGLREGIIATREVDGGEG